MDRFYFTKEQRDIYLWLKDQGLNTDDDTLNLWARTYRSDRIKDVVCFAQERLSNGQKIVNIGGWIHKFLKTGLPVENAECKDNRKFAQDFARHHNWVDLVIYEKYIRDKVTNRDLSLIMPKKEFYKALQALYNISYLYREL